MISSKHLADAIYKITQDSSYKKDDVLNAVFDYVHTYKLESMLTKVVGHLEEKQKKDTVWETLDIQSGLPLDEKIVSEIKNRLDADGAKNVKNSVDRNLVGGFRATYRGRIYDASIKNQLQLLRNTLTK